MAKNLYFANAIFLLVSGCVFIPTAPDTQTTDGAGASAGAEAQISEAKAAAQSVPNADTPPAAETMRAMSKDEIRLVQARMTALGFAPGPVDGILGPKTSAALSRLQSGCAELKDLADPPAAENPDRAPDGTLARGSAACPRDANEIRRMQSRMKAAGFDPGPVDGIMGPKTKSTLAAIQSGCAVVKDLPINWPSEIQYSGEPARTKRIDPFAVRAGMKTDKPSVEKPDRQSSDEIQLVQVKLKHAGFDPGPIDGIMGPKTRAAIQHYRVARGLRPAPKPVEGVAVLLE